MQRIQLLVATFLIALGIAAPAQAGNVTLALTAFVQDSIVETSSGVFEHTAVKVRITQKEILTWLADAGYPITTGTLAYDGVFAALNLIGPIVPIETSHLTLYHDVPQIKNGIVDVNGEDSEKTKQQMPVRFRANIDPGTGFDLRGLSDTTFLEIDGETMKVLNKIALMGTGQIGGKDCSLVESNLVVNGSSFGTATHKMTFLGTGNLDGKPCTLSGKLTLRVNIEPA